MLPTTRTFVVTAALGLLLGGCNEAAPPSEPPAEPATQTSSTPATGGAPNADARATVNGTPVSEALYTAFHRQRQLSESTAGKVDLDEAQTLDELVTLVLLGQQATAHELDQRPEVVAQLELQRLGLLARLALAEYLQAHQPSQEQIQAAYDARYGGERKEYKARHILLKTEDEAKAVIAELDKGADFATLAKERSTGPSGPNGGDLGWFDREQMVAPFAEAAATMTKGSHSESPVQTQFGWHVIQLEDVRDAKPPTLAQVQVQLTRMMQQKSAEEYLNGLKAQAKIETHAAAEAAPSAEPAKPE